VKKHITTITSIIFLAIATLSQQPAHAAPDANWDAFINRCLPNVQIDSPDVKLKVQINQKTNFLYLLSQNTATGEKTICNFPVATGKKKLILISGSNFCLRKDDYTRIARFTLFGASSYADFYMSIGIIKSNECVIFVHFNGERSGIMAIHGWPYEGKKKLPPTYIIQGSLSNTCNRMRDRDAEHLTQVVRQNPNLVQVEMLK
jgi:hypothetical protein